MAEVEAVVYCGCSIDGYIARADDTLDFLGAAGEPQTDDPAEKDYNFAAFLATIDVIVMGSKTFNVVAPSVTDDRESWAAWPYRGKRLIVLSRSMKELPPPFGTAGFPHQVELRNTAVSALAEELRAESAGGLLRIYVDGADVIAQFLDAGLVRELTVTTIPVLIGHGIPLFKPRPGAKDVMFSLVGCQSHFGNGVVKHIYRVR